MAHAPHGVDLAGKGVDCVRGETDGVVYLRLVLAQVGLGQLNAATCALTPVTGILQA